jgi:hypothetical protein
MKSTIKIIIDEILDELQYYRTLQYFRLAQKDVSQKIYCKVWKFFQNPRNSTYDEISSHSR